MKQLCFTSDKFAVEPGEQESTNPGRFGKRLAEWLKQKLVEKGYKIEEGVIPEDWGWLVMVQRKPCRLWVGCGNDDGNSVRWKVFVEMEPGLIQRFFNKANYEALRAQLQSEVEEVINLEPEIHNAKWEET